MAYVVPQTDGWKTANELIMQEQMLDAALSGLHHQGMPSLSSAGCESPKRPALTREDFRYGTIHDQLIRDLAVGSRTCRRLHGSQPSARDSVPNCLGAPLFLYNPLWLSSFFSAVSMLGDTGGFAQASSQENCATMVS
jgi:hypothetical protein